MHTSCVRALYEAFHFVHPARCASRQAPQQRDESERPNYIPMRRRRTDLRVVGLPRLGRWLPPVHPGDLPGSVHGRGVRDDDGQPLNSHPLRRRSSSTEERTGSSAGENPRRLVREEIKSPGVWSDEREA